MSRLPKSETQRIDESKRLSFTYAGKQYFGVAGDSVATAMFANGIKIMGRSLKYHRPRGLYSMDGETSNSLMAVNKEPNVRTETTMLEDGMAVAAQNCGSGSAESDLFSFIDKFDGMMPAGFYYDKFHKPAGLWPFFRDRMRKMAGTGQVDTSRDWSKERLEEVHINADVCVLGGGPAGMSAALAAAETGVRVVLVEGRSWLGGFFDWRTKEYNGQTLNQRAKELAGKLNDLDNVRVLTRTFVTRLGGNNLVTAFQVGGVDQHFDERYLEIRAKGVVVATGCIERPLIFDHNDRPGVMQVACAHRLAHTYGLLPGNKAVFSVGDDLGLEAALDLAKLGLNIQCVADARTDGHDQTLVEALKSTNIPFMPGWAASRAQGNKMVTGVTVGQINGAGSQTYSCDTIVTSVGLTPVTGPISNVGGKLGYDEHTNFFLPTFLPDGVHVAGRIWGYTDPASIEMSGRRMGFRAAMEAGVDSTVLLTEADTALKQLPGPAKGCQVATGPHLGLGRKAFICYDEDGTYKTAKQSAERGFDVPELAKRFGGFGLGPGQGGAPGHNLPLVLGAIRGDGPENLKPTTIRSPLTPVSLNTLAGPNHDIFKRTPLHDSQVEQGGIMRRIGVWKRARYFSQDFTSKGEIANVRNNVGLIDVSTLGKFRIHGPDALKALERCYISNMSTTPKGKMKYSGMLNDDGNLVDDGVITKVGENDYYFTSSTGRAGTTIEWFRYHTRYDELDFHMVNLTDALGAINLAGPKAREVLAKVVDGDVSNEAFPYMGYGEMFIGGKVMGRVMRLGFVGELSYELHVPASQTRFVWDALTEAGAEFDIKPFGLEAQFCCRLEKGHLIIGQESEARTNLLDLGMGFLWAKNDTDNNKVGSPALKWAQDQPDRLKLVGLLMDNPNRTPGDGSVVHEGDRIKGFVCSARYSHSLNKSIAMALINESLIKKGGKISIYQNDGQQEQRFTATVTSLPFYDPRRPTPDHVRVEYMDNYTKRSPILPLAKTDDVQVKNDWQVVVSYQNEGDGPHLVDLSHKSRWDLQQKDLSGYKPGGLTVPAEPGKSVFKDGWTVNRMNGTQASVWQLGESSVEGTPDPSTDEAYTEVTDGQAMIALIGNEVEQVWETLSSMDMFASSVDVPALFQGQVMHIPCQVVNMGRGLVVMTFSRGYGQAMAEAILEAGHPYGLKPGGEGVFTDWLDSHS